MGLRLSCWDKFIGRNMSIPIALIRKVCYPSGNRLPKLTRLDYKWQNPTLQPVMNLEKSSMTGVTVRGNLHNDEYRFFVGKIDRLAVGCFCRWCGEPIYTEIGCKRHGKGTCKQSLVDLYKRLLCLKRCMCCNQHTIREYWGLPLCSVKCENEWRFTSPPNLKVAIAHQKARDVKDKPLLIQPGVPAS